MGPAAEDFVTFGQIEPIVMVTREFVQKRDSPQESRSYFVYDLWAFHRDELVLANSVTAGPSRTRDRLPRDLLVSCIRFFERK